MKGKLTKATYKKLTKRPVQAEGREMLHKAVKRCAKALQMMWDDNFKYTNKSFEQTEGEMTGKYRFAMYYFLKYLIEEREFDGAATTKNMPVHIVFRRGDGVALATSNGYEEQDRMMARVLFDAMSATVPWLKDEAIVKAMEDIGPLVRCYALQGRPPLAEAGTSQASKPTGDGGAAGNK